MAVATKGHLRLFILLFIYLGDLVILTHGYVKIAEELRNEVLEAGDRAKFVCKIETHPLDEQRLMVRWKVNGRFLNAENSGRVLLKNDGLRYALIVRNVKASDAGAYTCFASVGLDTAMSTAQLLIKSPPEPPRSVKIISCHGYSAILHWEPGSDNGSPITSHRVQFNTSYAPDEWHNYDEVYNSDQKDASIRLYPWGTYSFRVISHNDMGTSKPSEVTNKTCTTPPDRPDRNPGMVRSRTDKEKMLVIEWQPMSRLYHHGPRFQYMVKWRMRGSFMWGEGTVTDPNQGYYEVETSDVYREYEIMVKAKNSIGEAHQPAYVIIGRSGESKPTVVPSNFSLNPDYDILPHTVHFMWDTVDPTDTETICGKFKGYKLRYWKANEEWKNNKKEVEIPMSDSEVSSAILRSEPGVIKVALSDLPAYTALRAHVAVMNTHHTGPFSQVLDFFTQEGVPSKVQDLRFQAVGVAYVLLKWKPPLFTNGVITGYNIAYQQVQGNQLGQVRPLLPHINDPSTLGARITGLRPGHKYRFIVWARTKQGIGDYSYVEVSTFKGQPPHPPQVQVSDLRNSSVNITWMSDQAARDMKYLVEYRQLGRRDWHFTDYVYDQSWMMLDRADVPVKDLEVRLVASNRLGDTATSKTIEVAKIVQREARHKAEKEPENCASSLSHWLSSLLPVVIIALVSCQTSLCNIQVFLR